ncbi:MAG: hypothetical protein R3F56_07645 [Planctomycetota bacterium]
MTFARVLLPALGLALGTAGLVLAQNPVPTRIRADSFGTASGMPVPVNLAIGVEAYEPVGTAILVRGGSPGALAVVTLGVHPTALALPFEGTLLVDPMVTVAGIYAGDGTFGVPVPLDKPIFVGREVLAQGLHLRVGSEIEAFQLTPGVRTTVLPGNAQPPLAYTGPPLTATFVSCNRLLQQPKYQLMTSVLVPTTGWTLRLQSVGAVEGYTRAYFVLEAPAPGEMVMPVECLERVWWDFGAVVEPHLQVLVETRVRNTIGLPYFALAAEIETVF